MKFAGLSINTNNVPGLVDFYSKVLRARAFGFKDPDGNNIDFLSPVKQ
ncbi:MAG: hypothetical protein JXA51_02645 [Dehalococcoidales bacterium]|nr:hypothetical protein [Dehalococcoidales bacterium]